MRHAQALDILASRGRPAISIVTSPANGTVHVRCMHCGAVAELDRRTDDVEGRVRQHYTQLCEVTASFYDEHGRKTQVAG